MKKKGLYMRTKTSEDDPLALETMYTSHCRDFNHLQTDDEILVKISISTVADDKILVIRSTYI